MAGSKVWNPPIYTSSPEADWIPSYKMDHERRGIALIFVQVDFANPKLETRLGSEHDVRSLVNCWIQFQFEIRIYYNSNKDRLLNHLEEVAAKDHSNSDCLVVCILSHGNLEEFHCHDTPCKKDKIYEAFYSKQSPSLIGKPKIILFQTCHGMLCDGGFHHRLPEHDSAPVLATDANEIMIVPSTVDFIIFYASFRGFVAHRHLKEGSPFIQDFCKEMMNYGFSKEFSDILLAVTANVSKKSFPSGAEQRYKQVPTRFLSTTKKLYFTSKEVPFKHRCVHMIWYRHGTESQIIKKLDAIHAGKSEACFEVKYLGMSL